MGRTKVKRERSRLDRAAAAQPGKSSGAGGILAGVALVAVGIAAYANSFGGQFVLDDQVAIVHNPLVHEVWPISRFAIASQPISDFSLAVNYALGGLDPWGYHFFNLCVHILAGLTLFGIVRRTILVMGSNCKAGALLCGSKAGALLSPDSPDKAGALCYPLPRADLLATAVAAVWLVHPLQTESVTYIVQRCESMAGLFYLLTLYCFVRYAGETPTLPGGGGDTSAGGRPALPSASGGDRSRGMPGHPHGTWMWAAAAVICCACGMATKPIVVTAPVVVLLYDRTFFASGFRDALAKRWRIYVGLAACWLVLAALGTFRGLLFESSETATVGFGYTGITPMAYLLSQPGIILHYLRLAVWPVGQCLDYRWPPTLMADAIVPGIIVVVMVTAAVFLTWRRRALGFLLSWFFVILAPTSSFVPIKDLAFEHRMYLPLAAVVVLVVCLVHAGLLRAVGKPMPLVFVAVVASMTLGLGVLTRQRNALYADPVALWADNVERTPENARAHNALGFALLGRREIEPAIASLREAVRLDPGFRAAYGNLGKAYFSKGRMEDAVREFGEAMKDGGEGLLADTHFYYGSALLETRKHDEALEQLQVAISKNPRHRESYYNLANALWATGDPERAAAVFQQSLEADPGYVEAWVNLGLALVELGRTNEAIAAYRNAIQRFKPGGSSDALTKAHYNLGLAMSSLGRHDEARVQYEMAMRINPAHAASRRALGLPDAPSR